MSLNKQRHKHCF